MLVSTLGMDPAQFLSLPVSLCPSHPLKNYKLNFKNKPFILLYTISFIGSEILTFIRRVNVKQTNMKKKKNSITISFKIDLKAKAILRLKKYIALEKRNSSPGM